MVPRRVWPRRSAKPGHRGDEAREYDIAPQAALKNVVVIPSPVW